MNPRNKRFLISFHCAASLYNFLFCRYIYVCIYIKNSSMTLLQGPPGTGKVSQLLLVDMDFV